MPALSSAGYALSSAGYALDSCPIIRTGPGRVWCYIVLTEPCRLYGATMSGLLQRNMDLEQRHHELNRGAGSFQLAKPKDHRRSIIGRRANENAPGHCGRSITMCAAVNQDGVRLHPANPGP